MTWVYKKKLEEYAGGVLSSGCEKNTAITVSDGMFSGRYLFNKINDFDVSVREVNGTCIHNIENNDETYTFLFFVHVGIQKINGDVLGSDVLYLLKPEKKLLTKSEVGSFCISLSISRKKLDEYKEKVGFPSGNLLNDKIYCSPSFFKDFKSLLYSIASYEDIFRQERFDSCEDDILGFIFELLKNESVEPFRTKVNTRYRVVRRAIEYIDGF